VNISYRFSSPQGDVVADDTMLDKAFAIGPSEYHQFMTLRDFFDCIRGFVLSKKAPSLEDILAEILHRQVQGEEIAEMVIRYEKYGTLYQICSIDVSGGERLSRMCTSVAFSGPAKQTLEQECALLSELEGKGNFGYLPRVYKKDLVEVNKEGRVENLLVILLEWFEGYEEWHFQRHGGSTRAFLWDMREGYRFLSKTEMFDTVCQASRILTLYYDVASTKRITPWHHGGGDFIVRTSGADVDVKLVTARGYEPIRAIKDEGILQALCAFCIEIMTKMRLDKWEGMGESTWADRFVLEAAMEGFFEGLRVKEARGEMGDLSASDVLKELKLRGGEDLRSLVKRQLVEMRQYDSSDYKTVLGHLDHHVAEIGAVIQSLRPDVTGNQSDSTTQSNCRPFRI
jgi:hypothetical protein